MTEDGKSSDPRKIPIDGTDEPVDEAAEQAAPSGDEASPAAEPSFADEVEVWVQNGAEVEGDEPAEAPASATSDQEVAQARAEASAMRDKYLRLQADWDNFRKRTAEENDQIRKRATERLMEDVLPVLDDFERAVSHAEQNGETGLLDGVKAIGAKLAGVLEKHGLKAVDPVGEPFDALAHQAVATVPDPSVPDETVAQVYQKGYRMGSKVIRSAMVAISSGGPKREPEPGASEHK